VVVILSINDEFREPFGSHIHEMKLETEIKDRRARVVLVTPESDLREMKEGDYLR